MDVLAKLKDIHLPDPIGWWPLAPGWYIACALFCTLVASLSYLLYKKQCNARAKKQGLYLLKHYAAQYTQEHNAAVAGAQVSELLKRVALAYYPRHDIASMHGDAWIVFLNQSAKGVDFTVIKPLLLETPFKNTDQVDLIPLFKSAESWIKQRKKPCLN